MESTLDMRMLMSGVSLGVTSYFWLVKARKERPNLQFYQLSDFRTACRRHSDKEGWKRLCFQQLDTGGVLVANHSTRQNSIIFFECYLLTDTGLITGDWGYGGDDKPPWNVGPESTISLSPACFFNVPKEFEVPENPEFHIQFITASGKQFSHRFTKQAPRLRASTEPARLAA
jgi:hypothetical protein